MIAKKLLLLQRASISIFFAVFFIFSPKISFAGSNLYGGEMYYKHIRGSLYKVYLVYYTNCSGTTPSLPLIGVTDGSTSKTYNDTICCSSNYDLGFSTGQCTLCSSLSCSFGFGVQFITVYATIDMNDFNGCKLNLYYSACCANNRITTGGADDTIYVSCNLNRCNGEHSSPIFQEEGLFLMNVYKPVDIYQTVIPANINDSIVYRLVPPLMNATKAIPYTPGYEYTFPMTYFGISPTNSKPGGFHFDSRSGELYFIPQQKDISLMAIEADEYEKNSSGSWYLAGTTTRTTTLTCSVLNSTNNTPQIESVAGTTNDTLYTCAGVNIALQFKTKDPGNPKDDMTILNVLNEPNGNISYSTSLPQSATFYWTPTNNDVRPEPYKVIMMADDGLSPMSDYSQAALYIFVKDSQPVLSIMQNNLGCGRYAFSIKGSLPPVSSYNWLADGKLISNADTASYTFPYNGMHVIHLQLTNSLGCIYDYYDSLNITILPNVQAFGGKKICQSSGTSLTAKGALQYSWYPTTGLKSDTGSIISAYPFSSTQYYVSGTDANGCKAIDSVNIIVDSIKIRLNQDTTECPGQIAYIKVNVYKAISYSWHNTSGSLMSDSSSMSIKLASDTQYILSVTDSFECSKALLGIIHSDQVKPNVSSKAVSTCFGDSIQLHASGGISYDWYPAPGLLAGSLLAGPYVRPGSSNNYIVAVTDKYGCSAIDSEDVIISYLRQLNNLQITICQGDTAHLHVNGGNSYTWSPKYNISNPSIANPAVYPDSTTKYIVKVCDTFCSCIKTDTFIVIVNPFIHISPGANREICRGQTITIGNKAIPGYEYSWQSDPSGFMSTTTKNLVAPQISTTYILYTLNPTSTCSSIDSLKITVDTFAINISGPQSVCQGDTQDYIIQSYNKSNTYTWKIAGGYIVASGKDNIIIIWDSSQNASITLSEELPSKCMDSNTININISARPSAQIAVNKKICLGSSASFVDLSSTGNSFRWIFGDGDTSNVKNPTYSYTAAGFYHISLLSLSGICSAFDSTTVQVFNPPIRTPVVSQTGIRKYLFDNKDSTGIIYTWYSGDGDSLKFSSASHIYSDTGIYKIVFDYSYPWGCTNSFDTTINVSNNSAISPFHWNDNDTAYIIQNPFADHISLIFSHSGDASVQISIFDGIGQIISQKSFNNQAAGVYNYTSQASQINKGMYFLKYQAGEKVRIFKIIKI